MTCEWIQNHLLGAVRQIKNIKIRIITQVEKNTKPAKKWGSKTSRKNIVPEFKTDNSL